MPGQIKLEQKFSMIIGRTTIKGVSILSSSWSWKLLTSGSRGVMVNRKRKRKDQKAESAFLANREASILEFSLYMTILVSLDEILAKES